MNLADMQLLKRFTNLEKYKFFYLIYGYINIAEACFIEIKEFYFNKSHLYVGCVKTVCLNFLNSDIIIHCKFS